MYQQQSILSLIKLSMVFYLLSVQNSIDLIQFERIIEYTNFLIIEYIFPLLKYQYIKISQLIDILIVVYNYILGFFNIVYSFFNNLIELIRVDLNIFSFNVLRFLNGISHRFMLKSEKTSEIKYKNMIFIAILTIIGLTLKISNDIKILLAHKAEEAKREVVVIEESVKNIKLYGPNTSSSSQSYIANKSQEGKNFYEGAERYITQQHMGRFAMSMGVRRSKPEDYSYYEAMKYRQELEERCQRIINQKYNPPHTSKSNLSQPISPVLMGDGSSGWYEETNLDSSSSEECIFLRSRGPQVQTIKMDTQDCPTDEEAPAEAILLDGALSDTDGDIEPTVGKSQFEEMYHQFTELINDSVQFRQSLNNGRQIANSESRESREYSVQPGDVFLAKDKQKKKSYKQKDTRAITRVYLSSGREIVNIDQTKAKAASASTSIRPKAKAASASTSIRPKAKIRSGSSSGTGGVPKIRLSTDSRGSTDSAGSKASGVRSTVKSNWR